MATQAEVMTNLLKRAQINPDQENIKNILSLPEMSAVQWPDEIVEQVTGKFLTVDDAKNNAELFNHFKAVHLNGVDATLDPLLKEIQDEAIRNELKGQSTSKKIVRLWEEYKKQADKKALEFSKDKDGIISELDKLRNESLTKDELHRAELQKVREDQERELSDAMEDNFLAAVPYGNDLPVEVNKLTARQLIAKEFEEKGIGKRRKGAGFELFNKNIPDIVYTENNLPVKYEDVVNRVLAKYKMITINKQNDNDNNNQRRQQYIQNNNEPIDYAKVSQVKSLRAEMGI